MKNSLLLHNLTSLAWKVICQQFWLLAVLSMLFCCLPLCIGPVAGELLQNGVDFSGITLAVCAPEGDETGMLLEELTGKMRDVRRYAQLKNMDIDSAYEALEAGEITAILKLPESFVEGVLYGENPDVTVVVREDQPMEALLTMWVGQSAADLLSSAQKGIYAVLEITAEQKVSGMSRDQILMDINLEYISATLNRQNFFRESKLSPTGAMDLLSHYGLSLLIFLIMAMPPVFFPLFSQDHDAFRRRLYTIGCGAGKQLTPVWWIIFVLLTALSVAPAWILTGRMPWGVVVLGLFSCGYCTLCCLLTHSAAGCGCLSLSGAAITMVVSGGLVPMPLLPEICRKLNVVFPGEMLRNVLYMPYEEWGRSLFGILGWTLFMMIASGRMHKKRFTGEVQNP